MKNFISHPPLFKFVNNVIRNQRMYIKKMVNHNKIFLPKLSNINNCVSSTNSVVSEDLINSEMDEINYNYFIKPHAARRRPAITRELTKQLYNNASKTCISLAEGMPNEETFPFENIQISLKDGSSYSIKNKDLTDALQYIPTQGYPPLVNVFKEFTKMMHQPPKWDNCELLITNGSQNALSSSIEMILNDGDPIIVHNPFYTGAEIVIKPYKSPIISVDQDEYGMRADKLLEALENWKNKNNNRKMPKAIYINPTGSNPSGATMSLERKKDIYEICCKYNLLILEDDAYYFINFSKDHIPSFLSIDVEGRVLRLDSLSKVLSSGIRIGWITGPKQLISNIELHIQALYLHTNTLSQVLILNLLKTWGFEKFKAHLEFVKNFYQTRRDITLKIMEKYLKGLAEWSVPSGGMFVWIKICDVPDIYDMILKRGIKKGAVFAPGHAFMTNNTESCNYIRASYSRASPEQIDNAMKLLAELIKEEQLLWKNKLYYT